MRALSLILIGILSTLATLGCAESGEAEAQETAVAETTAALQTAALDTPAPKHDPRALLEDGMAFLNELNTLAVKVDMTSETHLKEGVRNAEATGYIALSGKDDAYVRVENPMDEAELFSDGNEQIVHFVKKKEYIKRGAPRSRADIVGAMSGGPMRQGSIWFGKFLHDAPELLKTDDMTYVGADTLDGKLASHRLKLAYADYDVNLWLAQGDQPVPQRLELDLTRTYEKAGLGSRVLVNFDFSDWEVNPTLSPERFAFVPGDGVQEKVLKPIQSNRPGVSPLLGKPAPAIELELLGGSPFSLADHKDRDVVILEFWATWCGPCRQAMPLMSEVMEGFAGKNVVLYAINLKEDPARVQAFIDKLGFTHPVALDRRGAVQAQYQAASIPQTVIVGKDGTVQAVHRGFTPYMRKQIKEEVEKLLAGESLVDAAE